jgi:putative peptidoglycan lipid II flippase
MTDQTQTENPTSPEPKKRNVVRSAGVTSIAVFFSRISGVVREQVFAFYFGAGFLNDAFQVAFRIPNLLRDLVAEGALSTGVQKVFQDYEREKGEKAAWSLFGLVVNFMTILLGLIVLAGMYFSDFLVGVIAGGFSGEKAELTVLLTQIMFPFILLISLSAVAMAVLNTKGYFGLPQSASTVFNVVSIVAGLALAFLLSEDWQISSEAYGSDAAGRKAIMGMAYGVLIGGVAQLLFQLPLLIKVGFHLVGSVKFRDPGIRRVIRLSVPSIIGNSAPQVNVLVNTFLVSGIAGGISWLGYSFRLFQLPVGLFAIAIVTASLPLLNDLGGEKRKDDFRDSVASSMNLIMLLMIPATVGLLVLGKPIMRLLYAHGGAFTEADVEMTAYALGGYAIGMTAYGFSKLLTPAFTSLNDPKIPMRIGFASIIVNILVSYSGMILFAGVYHDPVTRPYGLAHVGVALGASLVLIFKSAALIYYMRGKIGGINGRQIFVSFLRITGASLVMGAVCWGSYELLHSWLGTLVSSSTSSSEALFRETSPASDFMRGILSFGANNLVMRLIETLVPVTLGIATFFVAAKIFKVDQIEKAVGMIRRKVGKSAGR